jgi:hypothetical protein
MVDRDLLSNIRSNLFYFDLFAGNDLVLLATGFYDRVHISPFCECRRSLITEWRIECSSPCKTRRACDSSTGRLFGGNPPVRPTRFL